MNDPGYTRRIKNVAAGLLILLAAGFLLLGYTRGEASVVLQKAVHICLECIGIG